MDQQLNHRSMRTYNGGIPLHDQARVGPDPSLNSLVEGPNLQSVTDESEFIIDN